MPPKPPLIVNCARDRGRPDGFLSGHFGDRLRWQFVDAAAPGGWAGRVRRPDVPRLAGAVAAGWSAARSPAALVVSHDPRVTFACQVASRGFGFRGPHLAFSFNFPALPHGVQLRLMRLAFRSVDRFVVYSNTERQLYHSVFDIPIDKTDFIYWGVNSPRPAPADRPLIPGDYACAIGGNARDYATLFEAMRATPRVKLVVVVRPHNLAGLDVPSNVEIRTDIPLGNAMNILAFSRFMALPLAGGDVPCGHVTLVSAMHLGKAVVISNSAGVADYVRHGVNALACETGSPDAMAGAVRRLWEDRAFCDEVGGAGKAFATKYCSEASTLAWFTGYLTAKGLLRGDPSAGAKDGSEHPPAGRPVCRPCE